MTAANGGRRYIEEAQGRVELVRLAWDRAIWATAVREAQESVELFLKGAMRLVAVDPARTHDVAEVLRRAADRFPAWFCADIDHLASISTEMAGDRGIAFYDDERQSVGPQDLFDRDDAARALGHLEYVGTLCARLIEESKAQGELTGGM